jgi:hypothetical protein
MQDAGDPPLVEKATIIVVSYCFSSKLINFPKITSGVLEDFSILEKEA